MWLTLRAMALVLFVSVCAAAQTRTLAVYSEPARELDDEASSVMHLEVQRLLSPAGLHVIWKNTRERSSGEDFELVVVGSFLGTCSASRSETLPDTVILGDTSITDGHILPFFRVDCGRLVQLLGEHPDSAEIGRALGRVIAHEIYHIVAKTKEHHDTGVAKAAFTARDLLRPWLEFDAWSLARMQPASVVRIRENSTQDAGR